MSQRKVKKRNLYGLEIKYEQKQLSKVLIFLVMHADDSFPDFTCWHTRTSTKFRLDTESSPLSIFSLTVCRTLLAQNFLFCWEILIQADYIGD